MKSKRVILWIMMIISILLIMNPDDSIVVKAEGEILRVPGLVMGLRHNVNQQLDAPGVYTICFSGNGATKKMEGGDLGAPNHRGFEWWMIPVYDIEPANYKLPPGVVIALKHSQNQKSDTSISAFDYDPVTGPSTIPGFTRQVGGDRGAPSGTGYYWYESNGVNFSDWSVIDRLPKYTVVGLKHSLNQSKKCFYWKGKKYDPADSSINPPDGFERRCGGDLGSPSGTGYFWYEKVTGPEVIVKPSLTTRLPGSIYKSTFDSASRDMDMDNLVDSYENRLAVSFCPYMIFDSHEIARQDFEPLTLFQVTPISSNYIAIKWVFLFRRDGGYGPAASPFEGYDSKEGDNDSAKYIFHTSDGGVTWKIVQIVLSDGEISWPSQSRLEVYNKTYPVIYLSASKHHEYFTKDYDKKDDSIYSDYFMNDNVDGLGYKRMANIYSYLTSSYNNVGERYYHPASMFVDDLGKYYKKDTGVGYTAWGPENFYGKGPISGKWLN